MQKKENEKRLNLFNDIMKEKQQMIDHGQYKSFREMDALIQKLGYLDYRDFLAANKYILEA